VVSVILGRVVMVCEMIAVVQWQFGLTRVLLCFILTCRVRVDAVS